MSKKLFVLLGDVVSSRKIENEESFQNKLLKALKEINHNYKNHLYARIDALKGIDELGAVLSNISKFYEIIDLIRDRIFPQEIRFVLVFDEIKAGTESKEVSMMDGPAFSKASELISNLKKRKLLFDMKIRNKTLDKLIVGLVNSILVLKSDQTSKQREVSKKYEKLRNQTSVAKEMGISQQAVSNILKRSRWREIKFFEKKLNSALEDYSERLGA